MTIKNKKKKRMNSYKKYKIYNNKLSIKIK